MPSYRYQSIYCLGDEKFDTKVNELGAKGWRVISVHRRTPGPANMGEDWIAALLERETKPAAGVGYGGDVK